MEEKAVCRKRIGAFKQLKTRNDFLSTSLYRALAGILKMGAKLRGTKQCRVGNLRKVWIY